VSEVSEADSQISVELAQTQTHNRNCDAMKPSLKSLKRVALPVQE